MQTDDDTLSIVDPVNSDKMLISWDVGRRCNYDCTYCPTHRHDNFSPHASLEELQESAKFVFEYLETVMPSKTTKQAGLSFTGGEPTANPNFVAFGQWLRATHEEKYKHLYQLDLSLTTNGAMSRKMCDRLLKDYQFATVSYHVEAKQKVKNNVVANILYLRENKFALKVNVMFHALEESFEECRLLCDVLADNDVDFVPRMIGEYKDNNRYHHKYSPAQAAWMKTFWDEQKKGTSIKDTLRACEARMQAVADAEANPTPTPTTDAPIASTEAKPVEKKVSARQVGRPCCGKRPMSVCSANTNQWSKTTFLPKSEFENWYCTVNWFFLHIEQQTGKVYHHQTCQANFGKKREPIADLSDTKPLIDRMRGYIETKTMPVIVCPNHMCGCGLCTPKAVKFDDLRGVMGRHVDLGIFENNPLFN